MTDTPKTQDSMVAALLREREGFTQRGLNDRVEQVDEQLRLRGYSSDGTRLDDDAPKDPDTSQTPAAPARTQPPKGRRAQRPETA